MASTDDRMLADLRAQAEGMDGSSALPRRDDGEPVFDQPWQGRAVALAIETVASLGLSWDDFRNRLIAAIGTDPHRDYYESWLVALDELVADHHLASREEIDRHRMTAAGYRTTEDTLDDLEVFPVPADEGTLQELLTLALTARQGSTVESDVALRDCAHAELQRQWIDGGPATWMFRMFDGDGNEMLTVALPNPFVDDAGQPLDEPDWSRLALWDTLRGRFLDLPPDPVDRSAGPLARS